MFSSSLSVGSPLFLGVVWAGGASWDINIFAPSLELWATEASDQRVHDYINNTSTVQPLLCSTQPATHDVL